MSATIKYKGNTIANITETANKTLKTSGKYCEADIVVENVQDGGITPTGQIDITENGTFDVTAFASALVNVEGGGDLPSNMIIGEFTPQEKLTEMTIDYDRDTAPTFATCFLSKEPTSDKNYLHSLSAAQMVDSVIKSSMCFYSYNGSYSSFYTNNASVSAMDETKTTFNTRGASYLMKSGFTYTYIIAF